MVAALLRGLRSSCPLFARSTSRFRREGCVGTPLAHCCCVEEDKTITGDACVEALLRAGFRIRSNGNGIAILVRGTNVVMVPDLEGIEPALMHAILRSAGLTREELDAHLQHHPKRSGFFPRVVLGPPAATTEQPQNDKDHRNV